MTKRQTKKQKTSGKRIRPGYVLAWTFFLVLTASSAWNVWNLYVNTEEKMAKLNSEKAQLIQEQKKLEEEIALLNTPSYIEQLAREQLGLVKKGEILIAPRSP
ncbi:FtsB family cell division protein [Paradesulfitobacterium ferrireducens]|uniref:FtsB family cell division protein n=1 Tax=Paradesulfitobacterium ferrireducens TaxID=2816476 RepID=UPI001F4928D0|nr:septum formation initiator family protein [Paradesulfitobacterium ferrireducens]